MLRLPREANKYRNRGGYDDTSTSVGFDEGAEAQLLHALRKVRGFIQGGCVCLACFDAWVKNEGIEL